LWYEWDDAKNQANIEKHRVDFEEVFGFRWETALQAEDCRNDYGEPRWIAIGFIGDRLHTLIYTRRDESCRVISLRKSNPRERRAHEETKGTT